MGEDLYELPKGWVWAKLEDVVEKIENINPSINPEQEFVYLDIASIDNSVQKITQPKTYLGENAPSRARQIVKAGDILFSTVRTYLKNIAVVPNIYHNQIASTGFCVIRPSKEISQNFIFLITQNDNFLEPLNQLQRGTSYPAVRDSDVFAQNIPLPPLPEQYRIVAKIEELFTQLDAGVELLKKVKAKLKRYRQAVLKAAVEGNLTAYWRTAYQGELEPASVLLERILKQRREKWEAEQLAKMQAQGKTPKDDSWKLKYKEPVAPETPELPELPYGWCWGTFDQACERVTVGHVGSMKDEYIENGIPFLRSQNVRENRYDPEGLKFISPKFHTQLKKSSLEPGDLVVVRSGSVGVSCVIPENLKEANCSDLVIVKQPKAINPYFATFYMNSIARTRVTAQKVGVALIHFNTQSMAAMPVPIPSIIEQLKIVEEVERLLSVIDQLEKTINTRVSALKDSAKAS